MRKLAVALLVCIIGVIADIHGAPDTAQVSLPKNETTVSSKNVLAKTVKIPQKPTNWSKIKDLFM